jgi:Tfp pilus assembly protein FimT
VKQQGFSLAELTLALAIGMMVLAIGIPSMSEALRRSRLNGATRQLVSDVRDARARATMRGWEFRVVACAPNAQQNANRYRLIGRSSAAVAWPDVSVAPFQSATQSADIWRNIDRDYTGVTLAPRNGAVEPICTVTFNSQGAATISNSCYDPFELVGSTGDRRSVRVSTSGGIRTQ